MARLGVGPVFVAECLTSARRWQVYAARAGFVALLLGAMGMFAGELLIGGTMNSRVLARIGENLFYAIVGVQLTLILLASPAATAGTICLDKARGTLSHMMMTDLSSAEIVLGKLAARLVPVLGLMLCAVPVVALASLLGGIDPAAMLGAFAVTAGVAAVGSSLALLLSIWGRKPHDVLVVTYAILLVWALADPVLEIFRGAKLSILNVGPPDWLQYLDPYWLAFAPYWKPGTLGLFEQSLFLLGCLVFSGIMAALATVRIRAVAGRGEPQSGESAPRRGRLAFLLRSRPLIPWPGPSLDRNPVLWRQWHYGKPSKWVRVVWGLFHLAMIGMTGLIVIESWANNRAGSEEGTLIVLALYVLVGLLLVSVTAPTALAVERVRGSLDVLLTTPLSTPSIIWGKWWGTTRGVSRLCILPPLLIGLTVGGPRGLEIGAHVAGLILAYGAILTALGLALATWTSRLGRAIGLSVTAYVAAALVWPFAVMLALPLGGAAIGLRQGEYGFQHVMEGLVLGSPMYGPALLAAFSDGDPAGGQAYSAFYWARFWIGLYGWGTLALLALTLRTFDRCLGRIGDEVRRPISMRSPSTRRHARTVRGRRAAVEVPA